MLRPDDITGDAPERPYKRQAFLDAIANDPRVDHGLYVVLSELAHRADNKTGVCWPGQANIGFHLRYDRRTVSRQLTKGKALGYVARLTRGFGNQHGVTRTNKYRLIMPVDSSVQCHPQVTYQTGGTSPGVGAVSPRGPAMSPLGSNNSKELSRELSEREHTTSKTREEPSPERHTPGDGYPSERETKDRNEEKPGDLTSRLKFALRANGTRLAGGQLERECDAVVRRALAKFPTDVVGKFIAQLHIEGEQYPSALDRLIPSGPSSRAEEANTQTCPECGRVNWQRGAGRMQCACVS
jgi:hypothetical protein